MALGKRKTARQQELWVCFQDLPRPSSHPFYERVNEILRQHNFDEFAESLFFPYYTDGTGRPGIPAGNYFRMLMVGYFEGITSERGIAWRFNDSLSLRSFLGLPSTEPTPDHSSLSRIRTRVSVTTHQDLFHWVLSILTKDGILVGENIGIDATNLEANAAMRGIIRRDNGKSYRDFLVELARNAGIENPATDDLIRIDRTRKKKTSNVEWMSPVDTDSRIAKMKDGSVHLAHKVEHAVDLDSGGIVAVTLQPADLGDTTTIKKTMEELENTEMVILDQIKPEAEAALLSSVVADKGYHSDATLVMLAESGITSVVAEPKREHRNWDGKEKEKRVTEQNREMTGSPKGKELLGKRGEVVERSFAHCYETGGMRRIFLRGHQNIFKRLYVHIAAFQRSSVPRSSG